MSPLRYEVDVWPETQEFVDALLRKGKTEERFGAERFRYLRFELAREVQVDINEFIDNNNLDDRADAGAQPDLDL